MGTTITAELIEAALADETIYPDGHTIFYPEHYAPHFDVEAAGLVLTYESDGTHKGSIYDAGGNILPSLKGVYNLHFLRWLAVEQLGLAPSTASGRGFAAQWYFASIQRWLKEQQG